MSNEFLITYINMSNYVRGGILRHKGRNVLGPHLFTGILCVFDDFRLDSIQNHTNPCMPAMVQCLFKLIIYLGGC